jgi:hypothetical protein
VDDDRDVGVDPADCPMVDESDDPDRGQDDQRDGESGAQRVAADDLLDERAAVWPVLRGEHEERRDPDDRRDDQGTNQHRQADPAAIDRLGGGHCRQEECADVGDHNPDHERCPDDRAERDQGEDDLSPLGDATEQERRGPAEGRRQDAPGEAPDEPEDRGQERH